MNPIPGSTAIGYGFNALGPYDPSSLTTQAFKQTFTSGHTYQWSGTEYAVPDNINVEPYSPQSGGTRVYTSQYDLQQYLSVNADVQASYGAFSGQITAAYSSALQEWGSCYYALTNAWITCYMLVIQEVDQAQLTDAFRTTVNNLPSSFDPANPLPFFEFFQQYGTHYVHGVGVGGYFCYYEAVENNGTYTETQVNANVNLEYNAVFTGSVNVNTAWQQLGEQWANSRQVTIQALGGANPGTLTNLDPTFDSNATSSYQNWLSSIQSNPSEAQFYLRGWDDLFPPDSPQQLACQQALSAYMNYYLYVRATINATSRPPQGGVQTNVLGQPIEQPAVWPQSPSSTQSGLQVILVDGTSWATTFAKVYYFDASVSNSTALYTQLMADLQTSVDPSGQWCCCAAFNYPWGWPPDEQFLTWLGKFGITATDWLNAYNNSSGNMNIAAAYNYLALGLYGGRVAKEALSLGNYNVVTVSELSVNPFLATK